MASRQRLRLIKSRRRDPYAPDFGRFWLHDDRDRVIAPRDTNGFTLDDVERFLTSPRRG